VSVGWRQCEGGLAAVAVVGSWSPGCLALRLAAVFGLACMGYAGVRVW